jgi:hypothetical protein
MGAVELNVASSQPGAVGESVAGSCGRPCLFESEHGILKTRRHYPTSIRSPAPNSSALSLHAQRISTAASSQPSIKLLHTSP